MKTFIRRLICCIRGHRWQPTKFTYWVKEPDKAWEYISEPAKYCLRCGKFVVPNSSYPRMSQVMFAMEYTK